MQTPIKHTGVVEGRVGKLQDGSQMRDCGVGLNHATMSTTNFVVAMHPRMGKGW